MSFLSAAPRKKKSVKQLKASNFFPIFLASLDIYVLGQHVSFLFPSLAHFNRCRKFYVMVAYSIQMTRFRCFFLFFSIEIYIYLFFRHKCVDNFNACHRDNEQHVSKHDVDRASHCMGCSDTLSVVSVSVVWCAQPFLCVPEFAYQRCCDLLPTIFFLLPIIWSVYIRFFWFVHISIFSISIDQSIDMIKLFIHHHTIIITIIPSSPHT